MPRGHLKHPTTRVSAKKARGGSSRNVAKGGKKKKKRGGKNCSSNKHRSFKSICLKDILEDIAVEGYQDKAETDLDQDHPTPRQSPGLSQEHNARNASLLEHATIADYISEGYKEYETAIVEISDTESFVSIQNSVEISDTESFVSIQNGVLASFRGDDSYSLCDGVSNRTDSFTIVERQDGYDGGDGASLLSTETEEGEDSQERSDMKYIEVLEVGDMDSLMGKSNTAGRAFPAVKCNEDVSFKCAICLENLSSDEKLRLFRKCQHPMACRKCLHAYYIKNASQGSFPFRCYWPGCGRRLSDVQARLLTTKEHELQAFYERQSRQNIVRREREHSCREVEKEKKLSRREALKEKKRKRVEAEKEKIRRRVESAKRKICQLAEDAMEQKRQNLEAAMEQLKYSALQERRITNFRALQHCHACTVATLVCPSQSTTFRCRGCKMQSKIDVMTRQDVEALVHADVGSISCERCVDEPPIRTLGDLLVHCPSCFTLIIKDGGCDHMDCTLCLKRFRFSMEKLRFDE